MQNFNSFISAIDNDEDNQIEIYKKELVRRSDVNFDEISIFAKDNLNNFNKLLYIIELYNIFEISEESIPIVKRLGKLIFSIYMKIVNNLIKDKNEYSIYTYIDFFYTNKEFLQESKDSFFEATYPILSLETEDMSSFIAIACMRYIAILGSEKEGKIFLERYLHENKKGIYREDVEKEL